MKKQNDQLEEAETFSDEEAEIFAREIAQAEADFEEEQNLRVKS